ncbi:MAG: DUF4349 domain-containing protein [Oscillospiraceae bacterium]|nr:DUF4349 domain-containing protein [Oscillospiraceae bacterium]
MQKGHSENMKKAVIVFMAAACLLSLAACSSSRNMEMNGMYVTDSAPESADMKEMFEAEAPLSAGFDMANEIYYDREADGAASIQHTGDSAPLPAEQARIIIRNASMMIEAENAVELYRSLNEFNRFLGGYEFSSQTSHHDTYSSVEAVFKIPPEKLDEFMNYAGDNGRIIRSSTTSNDVTDQYFDMRTRVETKRRSLEAYYALLQHANTINKITTLQRTIDSIIEEIEAFEGRLRVLESLSEMATVSLYISQKYDPVIEEEERREIDWSALSLDDMGYFIRNGFISVVSTIAAVIQWILIAFVVTLPIWLIPTVIIIIIIRRIKKKKANSIKIETPEISEISE